MRKIRALVLLLFAAFSLTLSAYAFPMDSSPDFSKFFDEHGAIIMMTDPDTGAILYANKAASTFFGYSKEKLESLNIFAIKTMTPEELEKGLNTMADQQGSSHISEYYLAKGEIRTVEEYCYPVSYAGENIFLYIIHDITKLLDTEKVAIKRDAILSIIGSVAIIMLLILLVRNRKKVRLLKIEMENTNRLWQAVIDANDSSVYLKDENLRYVFVNHAFENLYQEKTEKIIGHDDSTVKDAYFSKKQRESDLAVLEKGTFIVGEEKWEGREYKTTRFPIRLLNGKYGVGAYMTDITEEIARIKQTQHMMFRHKIIADVLTISFQSLKDQLDYVLHQSLQLTGSQYGYIYLYDEDKREFVLNSWTNGVMEDCAIIEKQTIYQLDKTGLWGEVVRNRKPIVVNNFKQSNPLKKGYPKGHVQLENFMSIPVIVDEKIVAVVGLANNSNGYDDNDVVEMTLLMSGVWNALKRREIQSILSVERNKYLQTLISIGDGVLVVTKDGKIEMLNTVAQNLTGWTQQEAFGRHYKEVLVLSNDRKECPFDDPIASVLETDMKHELDSQAKLTSKYGVEYYLEDSAAPIKDDDGMTRGVVLVFRDVTEKKEQIRGIEYLSCHDTMTGLYNRRCFEDHREKIDIPENLPLSLIFADINGLKMTNDIFGHTAGDELIKKTATILLQACRENDVIARVGGDEFIILLPKTDKEKAERIVSRIKIEFSNARIEAIKCSVSLGSATKLHQDEPLEKVIADAENAMYKEKTMNRKSINNDIIETIINTLHSRSAREKQHSIAVSELCGEVGSALKLPEALIEKLKFSGYLHDIGKITFEDSLLLKVPQSEEEFEKTQQHPVLGYRILNLFDTTLDLAEYVYSHHERWDGSGYPRGLKGEQIPFISRIISVVETYERVLTSEDLPLKESEQMALEVIDKGAGTLFDPEIAELFVKMIEEKNT